MTRKGTETKKRQRGRAPIIPPLGVDFETALKGMLGTPPPPEPVKGSRAKVKGRKKKRG